MADTETIQRVIMNLSSAMETLKNVNSAKAIEDITELMLGNSKYAVYITQVMWNRLKEVSFVVIDSSKLRSQNYISFTL